MEELSTKFGNGNLNAHHAAVGSSTRFERVLAKVGMASGFWGKQAVMQAGFLLGCVALYTAAGLAVLRGHGNLAKVLAGAPTTLGLAVVFGSDRMARREAIDELARGKKSTFIGSAFVRTMTSAMIAMGIIYAAGGALPALGKAVHSSIHGQEATEKSLQHFNR